VAPPLSHPCLEVAVRNRAPRAHRQREAKLISARSALEPYVEWREQRLREAGFERSGAERLARDPAFDLHALLGLVDRGCSPDLAVRIAAPLDSEGTP
jgi:hypothetical protein